MDDHEREFIEFKAAQEERHKSLERQLQDIRDLVKNQEKDTDAQSTLSLDLNNRVTAIETELKSARRFVATIVAVASGISTLVATFLGIYLGS